MQFDESDGRYAMNYMRNMLFIIVTLSVLIYKYYINFFLFCFSFTVTVHSVHSIAKRVTVNGVNSNLYSFLLAKNLSICFTIILSYVILFLQH